MSAFTGHCAWSGEPITSARVSRAAAVLRTAGPHRMGMVQPYPWLVLQSSQFHVDELSESETQPYPFGAGSFLTWDGRLDNREDLLLLLHEYLSDERSDAALVAAAFEKWDLDAIPRLIGDWSLAIWDAARRRVVLARDFIGNRRLYYRSTPERLTWSSRLETLAASEDVRPDDVYVAGSLMGLYPFTVTPFAGIASVRPGHVVVSTAAGTVSRRYWTYSPDTIRYAKKEDYAEHLRALVTDAVRVRLRARGVVWSHLSGGWDSSTLVCVANRLIEQGQVDASALQPMTIIYDGPEADERIYVEAVERWCGLRTRELPYCPVLNFSELENVVPVPLEFDLRMEQVMRPSGSHVVLCGEFGDLLLSGGGGAHFAMFEPLEDGRPLECWRGFVRYAGHKGSPLLPMLLRALRSTYGPGGPRVLASTVASGPPREPWTVSPDFLPLVPLGVSVEHPSLSSFSRLKRNVVHELYRAADYGVFGSPEYVQDAWRTLPFTHRPLVEFILAVPRLELFDPTDVRQGLRRAMHDVLPPELLARTTKGTPTVPIRRALRKQAETLGRAAPTTDAAADWLLVQHGAVTAETLNSARDALKQTAVLPQFLLRCLRLEGWLRTLRTRRSPNCATDWNRTGRVWSSDSPWIHARGPQPSALP